MFKRNRTMSMLLAIAIIIVSILPASLVKANGDGTPGNPYIISVASDFDLMRSNLGSSYILVNDIDLSGVSWTMIGSDNTFPFNGNFDGQGHSITGLSINAHVSYTGLFGFLGASGKIKNLTITNPTVTGYFYVGVLVGYNQGVIENVTITNANVNSTGQYTGGLAGLNDHASIRYCNVSGDVSGYYQVGGLVGFSASSLIENSSAEVRVIGTSGYNGGLVGYNLTTSINNTYAFGDVSGGNDYIGGLVGYNDNSPIDYSYAFGNVSGLWQIGGLIGKNISSLINNSYASGSSTNTNSISSNILVGNNTGVIPTNSEWRNPSAYLVSYNSNSGSVVVTQSVDVNGIAATTPDVPIKSGYTFAGWYSDSGLTTLYNFATFVTANTRLYAKWMINSYIISFNSNEGSLVDSQSVNYRGTALPTTPTKTGFRFTGWYSDSELTTLYDFATLVTANTTLYAKWTINFIVSYNSNGGSEVASQTVDINGTATIPEAPTKSEYTIAGWYSDSDFITEYNFDAAVIADMTLYAKWKNSLLNGAIEDAQTLLASRLVGLANGDMTLQGHNDFAAIIAMAIITNENAAATQTEVDAQVTALAAGTTGFNAIAVFVNKATLDTVISAANTLLASRLVGLANGDMTQQGHNDFATIITAAISINGKVEATQAEVDEQVTALAAGTTAFNAIAVVVSKGTLAAAISAANTLLASRLVGLANGDMTQQGHDDFVTTINLATAILDKESATQAQVDAQVSALADGTTAFNNSIIYSLLIIDSSLGNHISAILNAARNEIIIDVPTELYNGHTLNPEHFNVFSEVNKSNVTDIQYISGDSSTHIIKLTLSQAIPVDAINITIMLSEGAFQTIDNRINAATTAILITTAQQIDLISDGVIGMDDVVSMIVNPLKQVDFYHDGVFDRNDIILLLNQISSQIDISVK
jgi:uncharacterized repeat protein (TIGR02543 family)